MSTTFQLNAGGFTWEIQGPETAQPVTLEYGGKDWPMEAVQVTSDKGEFWLVHYEFRMWREGHRPWEKDVFIILDKRRKPIVSAGVLHDALWSVATGRPVSDLDISTTANGPIDPNEHRRKWWTPWQQTPGRPTKGVRHVEQNREHWNGL